MAKYLIRCFPLLPHEMIRRNVATLCAEAMLKTDQCHGARVSQPGFVFTAGFYGREGRILPLSPRIGKLCPLNPEWREFAQGMGLDVSPGVSLPIKDGPSRLALLEVMCVLSKRRDFLTLSETEKILGVNMGLHRRMLGEVLEGLVLILTGPDGRRIIVKFKFANYVWRTMGLRQLMEDLDKGKIDGDRRTFECFAARFCSRWCSSDEGRRRFELAICSVMLAWVDADGWLRTLLKEKQEDETDSPGVASHILAADLYDMQPHLFEKYHGSLAERPLLQDEKKKIVCIFVLGPVGGGKTSFCRMIISLLEEMGLGHLATYIDGDSVCPTANGFDFTPNLGKLRADVTAYRILMALSQGQVPIVACGGGVLLDNGETLTMDRILNSIGFSGVDFVLVLAPGQAEGASEVDPDDLDAVDKYCYTGDRALEYVRNCVTHRGWNVDGQFCERVGKNHQFYRALHELAGHPSEQRRPSKALKTSDPYTISALMDVVKGVPNAPFTGCLSREINAQGWIGSPAFLNSRPSDKGLHLTAAHSSSSSDGAILIGVDNYDFPPTNETVNGVVYTFREVPLGTRNPSSEEVLSVHVNKKLLREQKKNGDKKEKVRKPAAGSFVYFPPDLGPWAGNGAHLTVNHGPFRPDQMRNLARALDNKLTRTFLSLNNINVELELTLKSPVGVLFSFPFFAFSTGCR